MKNQKNNIVQNHYNVPDLTGVLYNSGQDHWFDEDDSSKNPITPYENEDYTILYQKYSVITYS